MRVLVLGVSGRGNEPGKRTHHESWWVRAFVHEVHICMYMLVAVFYSIQDDLFVDDLGTTYFSFWDVSFYPVNKSTPFQTWHLYSLVYNINI